ncbi:MAG: UDP-N-acetylglucosamine 1-carboxyvinyltransferase [Candidatus Zambryskibacteria bacterium CG_4_9_14_3_um_filter_42_9]|uniref:UDP-N-acetylglucosamine 1-carboxyvinyltransferase n=1 Tax=Candidatus Zambryskibacteria bacterium CG22_combo_CG10-13_8_21_14_all_42_17 TaxID=1975118 RepID=A0A2H0BCV4_9BACT|nr:MAG: UDP-N-acetylglucosamine 1-carboxyvinyltransferase [Candidatus Zambryskibacteria bacterium CG22_combo_CG10-13_8_21_14_all_42_17]PJA36931.1 MAG: UDP-N-acetylglucosamine 1-carboxyvinyltransferase [Candidatus Zambryskibacteria bacterium CG_4_9_14_3_um_filter_42_9]
MKIWHDEKDDFEIEGGHKLRGKIITNASKNGATHLFAAALVNRGTTILHNIPRIEEVNRFIEVFKSLNIKISWTGEHTLTIKPPRNFSVSNIDTQATGKIRSALMLMGPLSARLKSFKLPHIGGCKMGERTISAHRFALEDLGLKIVTKENFYEVSTGGRIKKEVVMYEASDTGTTNAILRAAVLPPRAGKPRSTVIDFAQQNYMVLEVCFFLQKLGIKISGIGTKTITVEGNPDIEKDLEYHNSEDPVEAMLFITAAIMTNSKLVIQRAPIDFLKLELLKLEKMGLRYDISKIYLSQNGHTKLVDLTIKPSKLKSLKDKIAAQPYPGINTDNLPFFVPIATQAEGLTLVHDWMWEDRAIFFTELNRLGGKVRLADPHRVLIDGPTKFRGAQIVCPPALRPAVMLMVAMLGAEGKSILRNVYAIKRGYEDIVGRLNKIGAKIKILQS